MASNEQEGSGNGLKSHPKAKALMGQQNTSLHIRTIFYCWFTLNSEQ